MKKLSWILILILTVSLLSACGRKETVIYHEDTASISDAADNSIRTLDYSIPGDFGTLHVQAQVDTSLAAQNAPVATLSRNDFTDEDITSIAKALFDEKSYTLFVPYAYRSIDDLSAACTAWEELFKSYEDFADIPSYMIAEYSDAKSTLSQKKQDTVKAAKILETDGEIKWYDYPENENGQYIDQPQKFCMLEGTIDGVHYYLTFLQSAVSSRMMLYRDYCCDTIDYSASHNTGIPFFEDYAEQNGENSCSYTRTEADEITEDYMDKLHIQDYSILQTLDAFCYPYDFKINDSLVVEDPSNDMATEANSYLVYAGRNLNGIAPIYTDATFQPYLRDLSDAEIMPGINDDGSDGSGYIFSPDESNTYYGYESFLANIESDGLSYLIWNNPMKQDTIKEEHAVTLSFDQIDAIAKTYLDSHSDSQDAILSTPDPSYEISVRNICYGMIRVSDADHSSYSYIPAWYYLTDTGHDSFFIQSSYVIISAIDGGIYDPYTGTVSQLNSN